jgi:diguanylate cyclase (GGDEF)-like protein
MKLPPAGVWVGRGLAALGLLAVVRAVLAANVWALVAALGGFLAATGLALGPLVRAWLADQPVTVPSDFEHALDLLRRAHGATAAWAVGLSAGDLEVGGGSDLDRAVRERGAALVQLASADGRAHVAREPAGTFVAVGDFPFGAGLLLPADAGTHLAAAVADELRRLVASMRLAQLHEPGEQPEQVVSRQLAALAGGALTLEGIAKAGVELAHQVAQRGAAIVLPAAGAGSGGRVVALSAGADGRLDKLTVPPDAPVMRAIHSGVPVAAQGADDIFGAAIPDRRRAERAGIAYPLRDGHFVIGALVVTGPPIPPATPAADLLQRLVADLGSRLAAARAVHEAEQRAVRDPLTGLANRREFDHKSAIAAGKPPALVTLVFVDIDHFKRLNDTLGHQAGDSALRHVADILRRAVRDNDLVARIGGEEFAIWMPHTPIEVGLEVAGRIRATVESAVWRWSGEAYPLTLSCGVASYPETVRDLANLRGAADAALYAAKQGGRNRVERARGELTRRTG